MMQEEGCERLRVEEMLLFKCQRTALCHYKMEDVNDAGVWADAEWEQDVGETALMVESVWIQTEISQQL